MRVPLSLPNLKAVNVRVGTRKVVAPSNAKLAAAAVTQFLHSSNRMGWKRHDNNPNQNVDHGLCKKARNGSRSNVLNCKQLTSHGLRYGERELSKLLRPRRIMLSQDQLGTMIWVRGVNHLLVIMPGGASRASQFCWWDKHSSKQDG
jgi:hypothetical protein